MNVYLRQECVCFRKTREEFGGLSNMASGFPITLLFKDVQGGFTTASSESLYQACRFPTHPDVQEAILNEKNPMKAKFIAKAHIDKTQQGWDDLRKGYMLWTICKKIEGNPEFRKLLLSTGDKRIVEDSSRDTFWGAVPDKDNPNILKGENHLGRYLAAMRGVYEDPSHYHSEFIIPGKLIFMEKEVQF